LHELLGWSLLLLRPCLLLLHILIHPTCYTLQARTLLLGHASNILLGRVSPLLLRLWLHIASTTLLHLPLALQHLLLLLLRTPCRVCAHRALLLV
jgi:hypothetical protein